MSGARAFLADLREEIATHPAVNHLFLNRLATSPFSRQDYRVFAENHYPLVCVFTHYLERLLVRAPDSEAKLWLAKVLVDEYGEGSEGKDHSTMYARFLSAAGGDPARVRSARVPPPAHRFIAAHRQIVSERPVAAKLAHLDDNRFRFRLADPDGQKPLAFLLLEDHDVGVVRSVESQPHHFHFGQLHDSM